MPDTVRFTVGGMSCNGCSGKLQKALQAVAGVSDVEVVLEGGRVTVTYDPRQVSADKFPAIVEETGFDVVSRAKAAHSRVSPVIRYF